MADDDILKEAKKSFERKVEAEADNRKMWLDDLRFGRLAEQWPGDVEKQRRAEQRPCLTINRMPSFIRQIVNDSRQNKPQIKVKPVDDNADSATANMLSGLIRNIEAASNADVAYDTAVDFAVSAGFGYIRVDVEYSYDDSFDKHLCIKRVANPLMVYGDENSTEADSSDWNTAFVVDHMPKDEFKRKYKGAQESNWEGMGYDTLKDPWIQGDNILTAEYWKREEYQKNLLQVQLSDGSKIAVGEDIYKSKPELQGLPVLNSRPVRCYKIKHYIMTGAEVLETNEWAGKYIPIVPVYGEEINIEGKRYFRSLIRDAKDAQRMFNYWRSAATELVALAPRVPFIMEDKALNIENTEVAKWKTANTQSHAYLMYKAGVNPPTRLPLDSGQAVGAMSEALAAADDMKSIMGMFDASLGAKSNETSGRAIMARQREGDVSTFHFIDNLSRAIRHTGCILVDMIPMVYTGERIVRVLGEDGTPENAKLGQMPEGMAQPPMEAPGEPKVERIYDISTGKYDVAVDAGPGFTTRREEAANQMTEFIRVAPEAAPIIGDLLVKNLDWPQAEEIAERLKKVNPALQGQGIPPELQQQIQEGQQRLQELEQENQTLKMDSENEAMKLEIDRQKLQIEAYKAETDRMQIGAEGERFQAEMSMSAEERQADRNSKAVNVNVPENIGESVANAVAPVLADTIAQTIANMPPLKVAMPRMKRTPVRGPDGMIAHTIDEPMDEMVS
jgi:hypothetical protein